MGILRAVLNSIRSRLICLVLAVLMPALAAAAWAVYSTYQREKAAAEQTLRETAKALSLVIDRELEKRLAVVRVLATSPSLAEGNLADFYQQATQATVGIGGSIILSGSGGIILDTSQPLRDAAAANQDLLGSVLRQGPGVSGLLHRPQGTDYFVLVNVPVERGGQQWNVSLTVSPEQLQRVIRQQGLPEQWTAAVLDREGVVVARQPRPERWVGSPAHPTLREQLRHLDEGFYETVTLDGAPVTAFFSKSGSFGWAFAIGVPRAELRQSMQRAMLEVGPIALLLVVLAVLGAVWVGGGLVRPLRSLHQAAMALERAERAPVQPSGLRESDEVARALGRASERILDANQVLETRVAEAVAETQAAQQKLLHSQKMEALGQLTGGIAHDFNNLLQTLLSGQQMLAMLVEDPEALRIIESCDRAVQKAAKLTRQLLAFGRGQSLRPAGIDLRDHVLGMRELLVGALRDDIQLVVDMAPDLWPVYVDSTQLELAILNCVLNARDAMPNSGRLQIRASNLSLPGEDRDDERSGEFVCLEIEDSGQGIPPEALPKVFEPFFTTKDVGKGSGLGLAQVYAFATRSGGAAEVSSEVGRGTTVRMLLPRSGEVADDDRAAQRPIAAGCGEGISVLFVEDDALVADVVSSALQGMGFELLRAENGEQALEQLRSDARIDVLFSDVVMPGSISGFELAREAMKLRPGIKVVLATGYSARGGIDGVTVLSKPYTTATVVSALLPEPKSSRRGSRAG